MTNNPLVPIAEAFVADQPVYNLSLIANTIWRNDQIEFTDDNPKRIPNPFSAEDLAFIRQLIAYPDEATRRLVPVEFANANALPILSAAARGRLCSIKPEGYLFIDG